MTKKILGQEILEKAGGIYSPRRGFNLRVKLHKQHRNYCIYFFKLEITRFL